MRVPIHPPQAPPLPSRFIVERPLGAGSAAKTYLARDSKLDRTVVIKTVRVAGASDADTAVRFEREARAAASVSHPNVVDVFDFGSHAGTRYLVLRYVEGETLRQYLARRGRLSAGEVVRIGGQLLGGLGAIHAAGLVHRDVKPENVIVGRDGLLRITDFGIAVAPADIRLTTQGLVWGTPAYMAPEQVLGYGVSPATDLYAAGVILFELLTGRLPFTSDASPALAFAHVSASPPALRDVAPDIDVPPELEAVVRRALAKNPDDRFRTAADMAEALLATRTLADETKTTPIAAASRPAPLSAAPPVSPSRDEHPTVATRVPRAPGRTPRRAPWLAMLVPLLIAGVIAAVIGGRAAAGLFKGGGAPPAPTAGQLAAAPTASHDAQALLASRQTPTAPAVPTVQPTKTAAPVTPSPTSGLRAVLAATKMPVSVKTPTPTPTVAPPTATNTPTAAPPTATNTPTVAPPTATKTLKPKRVQPTATSTPDEAPPVGPTIAPAGAAASSVSVAKSFGAGDWQGAFAGDQTWYGRPWVAIYGAQSSYPSASIAFSLDAAPSGQATLALDGLDDEWPGNVSIAVQVNGVTIFSGPSPFQSWTGEGHGESANWTTATLTIPAGALQTGSNQITVSNVEPAANFGTGPYVLLSGAVITSP